MYTVLARSWIDELLNPANRGRRIVVRCPSALADEMFEKSGQLGVPVILVDGEVIVGFDKSYLESVLA
jgi:hypothetical protein